jgi:hypothetical protein
MYVAGGDGNEGLAFAASWSDVTAEQVITDLLGLSHLYIT